MIALLVREKMFSCRTLFVWSLFVSILVVTSSRTESQEPVSKQTDVQLVRQFAADRAGLIVGMNQAVWEYAEESGKEYKSAAFLSSILEKNGFRVKRDLAGFKTAFKATWGTGKPVIGILAEYDALPNLSQKAGATASSPVPGRVHGHGCGHSALGAAAVGAALIVKDYMEKAKLQGTVILFGCPAEERIGAKKDMIQAGLFNGLDAALSWHPLDRNDAGLWHMVALIQGRFCFHGVASHAGGAPDKGRSALDACEFMNVGVNYLREHVPERTRMHFAYVDSGPTAPTIVPAETVIEYIVRSTSEAEGMKVMERVIEIAKGAAMMAGVTMDYKLAKSTFDFLPSPILTQVVSDAFCQVGGADYDEDDYALARGFLNALSETDRQNALQTGSAIQNVTPEEFAKKPIITSVVPCDLTRTDLYHTFSSDVGNVSYCVPSVVIYGATAIPGTPLHSWRMVSQVGTSIGDKASIAIARALALGSIRLMQSPETLKQAHQQWQQLVSEKSP